MNISLSWTVPLNRPLAASFMLAEEIHLAAVKYKGFKLKWDFWVAQWLRICLPMQGTRVRALAREDPTCRGATKPMCHNY